MAKPKRAVKQRIRGSVNRSGRRKTKRRGGIETVLLGQLIVDHPEVLEVLDRHGVTFCAGCFITLFSRPEKAAAYHAVEDKKKFLRDLSRAAASKAGGRS